MGDSGVGFRVGADESDSEKSDSDESHSGIGFKSHPWGMLFGGLGKFVSDVLCLLTLMHLPGLVLMMDGTNI